MPLISYVTALVAFVKHQPSFVSSSRECPTEIPLPICNRHPGSSYRNPAPTLAPCHFACGEKIDVDSAGRGGQSPRQKGKRGGAGSDTTSSFHAFLSRQNKLETDKLKHIEQIQVRPGLLCLCRSLSLYDIFVRVVGSVMLCLSSLAVRGCLFGWCWYST